MATDIIDPFSLILIINECEELNNGDHDRDFYESVEPLVQMYINQNSDENDKWQEPFQKYKSGDSKDLINLLRQQCTGESIMNNIQNMLSGIQNVLNDK